jgi:hypothetical protein
MSSAARQTGVDAGRGLAKGSRPHVDDGLRSAADLVSARLIALCAAFFLVACESAPDKPQREPPPPPPPAQHASATATASASASSPPPLPSLSASAAPGDLSGAWEGHYDAKKGNIELPEKLKAKSFPADDGKVASGPGTVEITIGATGDIKGRVTGAIGAETVTGKVDGLMIRAGVKPDDPQASNAMTGILVGTVKDDVIVCELHVAGPDGTVIRESRVDLKRKK